MRSLIFLGLFLMVVEQVHAAPKPTTVRVRHEAQVAEGNIELGAIASITSTDGESEGVLRHLILGESPQAGKTVVWTAAEISRRLRPYSRILQTAELKVPDRVMIRRVVNTFTREQLEKQIEEIVKTRALPDSTWEAQISEVNWPTAGLNIPHGGSVQVVPPFGLPRGPAQFEVVTKIDEQILKRQWVRAQVRYFANVAVIQKQIPPHSRVLESDVKWEKKEVTFLSDIPVTKGELENPMTRSALVPGNILSRNHIEREQAAKYGEEVSLQVGDDSFLVTAKGVAQQAGFVGDTIKVKNTSTGKNLTGTLISKGTVRVSY